MKITQSVFIFMIKIYVVVTILALVVWVALLINNHIFHTTEVYGTISSDNPPPNECRRWAMQTLFCLRKNADSS